VRSSGQGRSIQVPQDVVPDVDRRGNLGQDHPRSRITYPQATRTRVPCANLTALANHWRYKLAEAVVSAYVQSAAGATTFVPPNESSRLYVQYDVFFEEINKYIFRDCVFV